MSNLCRELHLITRQLELHSFPFDPTLIPKNGIYILFENGEMAHDGNRIVRIGTHTGDNQLRDRLAQHFLRENKDRSIFRKNIGRAILTRANDPFLSDWNLDLTTSAAKNLHAARIDRPKQESTEQAVTTYMRAHLRFVTFEVGDKEKRLLWEARIISTVSRCDNCRPSSGWLGNFSPSKKIRESGLWQVNQLHRVPFSTGEFAEFNRAIDLKSESNSLPTRRMLRA